MDINDKLNLEPNNEENDQNVADIPVNANNKANLNALLQSFSNQQQQQNIHVNPNTQQSDEHSQKNINEKTTINPEEIVYKTKFIYHVLLICGLLILLGAIIFTIISLYKLIIDEK
jgi:hypothetical protein